MKWYCSGIKYLDMSREPHQNPQELIEKIREKVISTCPDIAGRNTSVTIPAPFSGLINYRDDSIGIAEILRTERIRASKKYKSDMPFTEGMKEIVQMWDLEYDHLEDQSKETLSFLWELLK